VIQKKVPHHFTIYILHTGGVQEVEGKEEVGDGSRSALNITFAMQNMQKSISPIDFDEKTETDAEVCEDISKKRFQALVPLCSTAHRMKGDDSAAVFRSTTGGEPNVKQRSVG
jgi:hypothetical protein